jgi:hypothetical protein
MSRFFDGPVIPNAVGNFGVFNLDSGEILPLTDFPIQFGTWLQFSSLGHGFSFPEPWATAPASSRLRISSSNATSRDRVDGQPVRGRHLRQLRAQPPARPAAWFPGDAVLQRST